MKNFHTCYIVRKKKCEKKKHFIRLQFQIHIISFNVCVCVCMRVQERLFFNKNTRLFRIKVIALYHHHGKADNVTRDSACYFILIRMSHKNEMKNFYTRERHITKVYYTFFFWCWIKYFFFCVWCNTEKMNKYKKIVWKRFIF